MLMFFLYWALALACWGFALRYGGASAQVAFALFLGAMAATSISIAVIQVHSLRTTWGGFNLPLYLVDLVYFLGLYALALRSRRYWPIWSAGFQLLCVLTHFGPLLDPVTRPKLYRGLESVWVLPMMLTMVIGIAQDRRHTERARQPIT